MKMQHLHASAYELAKKRVELPAKILQMLISADDSAVRLNRSKLDNLHARGVCRST